MIRSLQLYTADTTDPYWNLATEKLLLDSVAPGCCILYLWQNENTVVIGRNQNPWLECRLSLLESEGGHLARRLSGGGAVYHDLGNLNFTFILCEEDYDLRRQQTVIQVACTAAGIRTEISGRNDLLANGRKFSGNAFYHSGGKAYHHGTLLIDTDSDKLSRYLSPSKAKLQAKGVSSVRSRVINLSELVPGLTCQQMAQYMGDAFSQVYQLPVTPYVLSQQQRMQIESAASHFKSSQWLCATTPPFSFSCGGQFSWGNLELQLQVHKERISAVKVYTDAMDWSIAQTVEDTLTGCPFDLQALASALKESALESSVCSDLCDLLRAQQL